mgnify:CR=1 FL=1
MSQYPKIAITMRIDSPSSYFEPRDCISHDWLDFANKMNWSPILIPNIGKDVIEIIKLSNPDGIVMTGGGITRVLKNGDLEDNADIRDQTEVILFEYAIENDIPILGVCRGMQFIFKYYGGQIIESHPENSHVRKEHEVFFKNKTSRVVNSYHEYICDRKYVPEILEIDATTSDQTIESLTHKEHRIMGIQWHPERSHNSVEADAALIKEFFTNDK